MIISQWIIARGSSDIFMIWNWPSKLPRGGMVSRNRRYLKKCLRKYVVKFKNIFKKELISYIGIRYDLKFLIKQNFIKSKSFYNST